jgi:hypothetical protein
MRSTIWNELSYYAGIKLETMISGVQQADRLRRQVNEWIAEKHGSFEAGMDCGEYSILGFVGCRSENLLRLTVYLNEPKHIADFKQNFCLPA